MTIERLQTKALSHLAHCFPQRKRAKTRIKPTNQPFDALTALTSVAITACAMWRSLALSTLLACVAHAQNTTLPYCGPALTRTIFDGYTLVHDARTANSSNPGLQTVGRLKQQIFGVTAARCAQECDDEPRCAFMVASQLSAEDMLKEGGGCLYDCKLLSHRTADAPTSEPGYTFRRPLNCSIIPDLEPELCPEVDFTELEGRVGKTRLQLQYNETKAFIITRVRVAQLEFCLKACEADTRLVGRVLILIFVSSS
jgi:hypothetical protein